MVDSEKLSCKITALNVFRRGSSVQTHSLSLGGLYVNWSDDVLYVDDGTGTITNGGLSSWLSGLL